MMATRYPYFTAIALALILAALPLGASGVPAVAEMPETQTEDRPDLKPCRSAETLLAAVEKQPDATRQIILEDGAAILVELIDGWSVLFLRSGDGSFCRGLMVPPALSQEMWRRIGRSPEI